MSDMIKNISYRFIKFFYSRLLFFSNYIHSLNNENVFYFSGKKDKTEDSWLNGQPYYFVIMCQFIVSLKLHVS